jgi:hypothetical protein
MLKNFTRLAALIATLSVTAGARAQALPTATGRGGGLQIGGGATMGKPDFGQDWIGGITIFADYNLMSHIGVEANAHILTLHTPQDLGEDTYEAGPRFYWRRNRFTLYAKAQAGYGKFIVQEIEDNPGKFNATSFMYSLGGGLDVDLHRHITIRAFDFEYQSWPGFANHGLSPAIGTVGIAYRFR